MTLEELNSTPYLAKEIELYDKRLAALDREQKTIRLQGAERHKWNAGAEKYRQALIEGREQRKHELAVIQNFIDNISDPFLQAAFIERFENNMSWWDVCDSLMDEYGYHDPGELKMTVYRYLKKDNAETGAA